MSTVHPLRMGSDPKRDPPESILEVSVEVEHRVDLTPARMLRVAEQVAARIAAAVAEKSFADLPVGRVYPDVAFRAPTETPLYPLRMGERWFTGPLDLIEAIETLCGGTDLENYGYDFAGRAYEVTVQVGFRRMPELDDPAGTRPERPGRTS
ncbi:MAG TPA: hypothetical protein VF263_19255 [Longimicrobiaceae bacterium]